MQAKNNLCKLFFAKTSNGVKKYLIIGGAGFIGTHLSKALLAKGNKVAVIDIAAKSVNAGVMHYPINAQHAKSVDVVFSKEKPDFVFHLAGAINLRREITDPLFIKDMDFLLRAKIILDACKKHKVKKIIFVSSGGAVYENAKIVPTPEAYPAHPASLYGLANLMIEKYIELYCKNTNLHFSIARLSNVYGPGQWQSGFIPSIILRLLKNKSPVIHGMGNQTRDFVYVSDAVDALILLAKKGDRINYNIGSGKEVSLNQVFILIKDLIGINIKPKYKKAPSLETKRSAVDIKKIKKEFGWQPKIGMKEGLLKTIEFYDR